MDTIQTLFEKSIVWRHHTTRQICDFLCVPACVAHSVATTELLYCADFVWKKLKNQDFAVLQL